MDKNIPTNTLQRGKVITKTLLKIGTVTSKSTIKKKFLSDENKAKYSQNMHEEIAKTIFEALGNLNGISVKIAQQIALGMPFLPPAYLEEIQKSFHQVPPLNKAVVRKVLKSELGAYPEKCFDTFESTAFGSASLGQVHLAWIEDKKVAVKVQYPGIRKTIETDMSIINFGLKRFAKGKSISHITEEIKQRVIEEINYELEAQNGIFFAKHLNIPEIIIPKVYREYSTQRILTTEYLDGKTFQEFLQSNPSQKDINHYAQLIFESFFYSLYDLKAVHADQNPGNFIFMEQQKLGMIDFGCIKKIDDVFLKDYNSLHISLIDRVSDEEIIDQYHHLNMIDDDTPEKMLEFYQETIKPLDQLYIEIFKTNVYDFKTNKNFAKRGFELILEIQKKQFNSVHKVNEEFLFLDRTLLGYYAIFEQMGAKIDTRNVINIMRSHSLKG